MKIPGIPYVQGRNAYDDRDNLKFGIAIHNTSNDATAAEEASYATRRTDGISAHLYSDGIQTIQSLDTADKAGHTGSSIGNENAVAVEITGTNGKSRQWWLDNVEWGKLGYALAKVIRAHWPDGSFKVRRASVAEMESNPKVRAFYSHDDMRLAWGGTTHTDPGPNFPWDRLFTAVNTALSGDTVSWDQSNENVQTADTYRLYAILSMLASADYTITVNGQPQTRSEPNKLRDTLIGLANSVKELHERVARLETVSVAHGQKLDQILGLLQAGGGQVGTAPITGGQITFGPPA